MICIIKPGKPEPKPKPGPKKPDPELTTQGNQELLH